MYVGRIIKNIHHDTCIMAHFVSPSKTHKLSKAVGLCFSFEKLGKQ